MVFRHRFRPALTALLATVVAIGLAFGPATAGGASTPSEVGQWAAPVDIGMAAIHMALLPSGKVLMYGKVQTDGLGSQGVVFDPSNNTFVDATVPYQHNPFCGGLSFLPDGRLLATGGEISLVPGGETGDGTPQVSIYDWRDNTWSQAPDMANARWYPTNVELADGTTLVFGGRDSRGSTILQVERYDPVANAWTTLPPTADVDVGGLYPRALKADDGRIAVAGVNAKTQIFDVPSATWSPLGKFNVGRREAGSSVLLDDGETILAAGGSGSLTAETIDLSQPSPTWQYTGSTNEMRNHGNLVLLPDGSAMMIGGGNDPLPGGDSLDAERYDPATGAWTLMAPQQYGRQYHTTAVLLPDGRIISGGGEETAGENTVEIYSPPYLFKGPQPKIKRAPKQVDYGKTFAVRSRMAGDISRVVLMKPGATTHGFNQNQRAVPMQYTLAGDTLAVQAPASAEIAPPGYYMLFIVNSSGVPSVARFVHVG